MTTRPLGKRDVRGMRERSGGGKGGGAARLSLLLLVLSNALDIGEGDAASATLLHPGGSPLRSPSPFRLPSASRDETETDSARLLVLITALGSDNPREHSQNRKRGRERMLNMWINS